MVGLKGNGSDFWAVVQLSRFETPRWETAGIEVRLKPLLSVHHSLQRVAPLGARPRAAKVKIIY